MIINVKQRNTQIEFCSQFFSAWNFSSTAESFHKINNVLSVVSDVAVHESNLRNLLIKGWRFKFSFGIMEVKFAFTSSCIAASMVTIALLIYSLLILFIHSFVWSHGSTETTWNTSPQIAIIFLWCLKWEDAAFFHKLLIWANSMTFRTKSEMFQWNWTGMNDRLIA